MVGWYNESMAGTGFSFEKALDEAEHDKAREELAECECKLGEYLKEPYIFSLPATKDRLKDKYPDNYYMCRNGNRTAAAGLMERVLSDPAIQLSGRERRALQGDHDFIVSLPREIRRTEEEMKQIRSAIEEAREIMANLLR